MRAGVYLRISQDRTGEELGIDRQRADCLALVERRGWDLHEVHVENHVSAAGKVARPRFADLLASIERGEINAVVAWTLDRLVRTARDRLALVEACRQHDVVIALVRGSEMDPTTPGGRLAIGILGEVAQHEIDQKADRQRNAHLQAAQQGRRIGGRRPFGYEQDGVTIRDVEADAVRAAYRDYLAGTPLSVIAARWNLAGLTSGVPRKDGTGPRWEHTGVRHLLRNPRYMGMRRHQPKGQAAQDHPATWPALVDEGTWRAANVLLDSVASTFKPKGGRQLLTGIIRCAACDALLVGGGAKRSDTPTPMYRCPTGKHVSRRAEPIENLVRMLVRARLAAGDVAAAVAEREHAADGQDHAGEAAEIRAELDTIALERAQRRITPRQFMLMNTELIGRLADVEARLAAAGRRDALAELLAAGDPAVRFDELDRDQQRVVIGSLMRIRLASAGRGRRDVRRDGVLLPTDPTTVQIEKLRALPE